MARARPASGAAGPARAASGMARVAPGPRSRMGELALCWCGCSSSAAPRKAALVLASETRWGAPGEAGWRWLAAARAAPRRHDPSPRRAAALVLRTQTRVAGSESARMAAASVSLPARTARRLVARTTAALESLLALAAARRAVMLVSL